MKQTNIFMAQIINITKLEFKLFITVAFGFIFQLELLSQTSIGSKENTAMTVCGEKFLTNTFYTWTTQEQITELKKTNVLLTKSVSSKNEYSIYDLSLRDSSLLTNEFAAILKDPQFAKKRFAWVNSWATIMGWKNETYGDCLIKITLKDSAIIGKFDITNKSEPIAFYFLSGKKLTKTEIQLHKNKITAVYHVNNYMGMRNSYAHKNKSKTSYKQSENAKVKKEYTAIPFREYVIVNESMISNFSFSNDQIADVINGEINYLDRVKENIKQETKVYPASYCNVWKDCNCAVDKNMLEYLSSICFENDNYLYNTKKVMKIQKALQKALSK